MRIIINQLLALGPRTGIGHYTAELIRCLRGLTDEPIDTFPLGLQKRFIQTVAGARARWLARTIGGSAERSWWEPVRNAAMNLLRSMRTLTASGGFWLTCTGKGYSLYHEPNFIPLASNLPTVATIHDLSILHYPQWHPRHRVAYFEKHFHRGLARCQHFFAISEFARQEIARTLHIPLERITRTYMGIRPGLGPMPADRVAATIEQRGLPRRYLLYLGTLEPRKNVLTMLRAYCGLPDAVRSRWPLLLVGGWGWNAGPLAEYLQDVARPRGVLHLGYVADEVVPALYNGARALIYPSYYEGFGLPPVEMLACGGAVLASTAGAVAETVGRQAHLVAPDDVDGWRSALQRVVADDDWWRSLRQGAEAAARPFTWEQCAADTLRTYRKVCGLPADNPITVPETAPTRKAG
jgi:alpha-1,3-rhamnosyl/mannosyltransferase